MMTRENSLFAPVISRSPSHQVKLTPFPTSGCPVSGTSAVQLKVKFWFTASTSVRGFILRRGRARTEKDISLEPFQDCASKKQEIFS